MILIEFCRQLYRKWNTNNSNFKNIYRFRFFVSIRSSLKTNWINWIIFKWIHLLLISGESKRLCFPSHLISSLSTTVTYAKNIFNATVAASNHHRSYLLWINYEYKNNEAKTNELAVTHILFLEMVDYVFVLWTWLHLKSYRKKTYHNQLLLLFTSFLVYTHTFTEQNCVVCVAHKIQNGNDEEKNLDMLLRPNTKFEKKKKCYFRSCQPKIDSIF